MPEWLSDLITISPTLGAIGFLLMLGIGLWKLWVMTRGLREWFENFRTDWNGTPERRDGAGNVVEPARKGVIASIQEIHHEVFPNSGKSLRDAVDKQGTALKDHLAACAAVNPQTIVTVNATPTTPSEGGR